MLENVSITRRYRAIPRQYTPEPALSQTSTLPPLSTNIMNIRDDRIYWYPWDSYALHPLLRRIPFWLNSFIKDIRSLGTMAIRSLLLLLIRRVIDGPWIQMKLNQGWWKLAFYNIAFIKHSITKTIYKMQTITNVNAH